MQLPVWPTNAQDPFFRNAARVYNRWASYHVTMPVRIGMGLTQAEAESSFETYVVGDKATGGAYGLYQMHSDRCDVIKAATGIDIMKTGGATIEENCDAAWWELQHTETRAWTHINTATTAEEAAMLACQLYERAGKADAMLRRSAMATRWTIWVSKNPTFIKQVTGA